MPASISRIQFVALPERVVTSPQTQIARDAIRSDFPVAVTAEISTHLVDPVPAQSIADAGQAIFGTERKPVRITVPGQSFDFTLGDTITIDPGRFGLAGLPAKIIASEDDSDSDNSVLEVLI